MSWHCFIARFGMLVAFPALVLTFQMTDASMATMSCEEIHQRSQVMTVEGPASEWEVLYREAVGAPDCNPDFVTGLGRKAAVAITREVDRDLAAGKPSVAVQARLQQSLIYYRLWQALAFLGDIASESRRYAEAASRYEDALAAIAEASDRDSPDNALIAEIFRKAEENRLLAEDYVPTGRSRSGRPTGLAALSIRGFLPTRVAVPVTFEFDSVAFTKKGTAAAQDMLEYLTAQGSPDIELIGHTDPRGTDAYNLDLSRRRADAVRGYLIDNGYKGQVKVTGLGESTPFQPDSPDRYSEEERWQMDRRVELVRKSG